MTTTPVPTTATTSAADAHAAPTLGLPAWVYHDEAFFRLECEQVFRRSWQLVCHHSDVPRAGDYLVFDFLGESVLLVRGEDGELRAFYNFCRHRAARLLDGAGHCPGRIRCPYHAWGYDLRGRLREVPNQRGYRNLHKDQWGLRQIALRQRFGFVFVCLQPEHAPSLEAVTAALEPELAPYRCEQLRATGRVTLRPRAVNWKTLTDNYIDGLHINVAHTGLRRLAGRSYRLQTLPGDWVQKMSAELQPSAGSGWSERAYCALLRDEPGLAPERRLCWNYYLLWPNIAFDVYPEQIDFMQMLPLAPGRTLIREIPYALPGAGRRQRVARYLNWRINRVVNAEDTALVERVQQGLCSRGFVQGPLAETEPCLHSFAERLREYLPVCRQPRRPPQLG